jgi:hypothetical protein
MQRHIALRAIARMRRKGARGSSNFAAFIEVGGGGEDSAGGGSKAAVARPRRSDVDPPRTRLPPRNRAPHSLTATSGTGHGDAEQPLLPASAPLGGGDESGGGGGGGGRPRGGGGLRALWSDVFAFGAILASSWLNILLLCAPLALAARLAGWGAPATFLLAFGALVPLGLLLGELTEDVGRRSGPVRAPASPSSAISRARSFPAAPPD